MGKIVLFEDLSKIRSEHSGKRIVHCHGVFDLLHHGHLLHFQSAKKYGDILVVTVTPDKFVNKGPGRPRYKENQRAQMLAALELVDYVAINQYPKANEPILELRPDVYVKGPDYREKENDATGGIFEEEASVCSVGGKLVFTNNETQSATELINIFFSLLNESQKKAVERVKEAMSLDEILKNIDLLANLKVLVIGEPIVDTYIFCQPESLSSKSPTVSARFIRQEDYAGGSLAIANHLASLGCKVNLLITHGGEDYFNSLLKGSVDPNILIHSFVMTGIPTPRKTRFLAPFRSQRIFEFMDLRADQWVHVNAEPFCEKMKELARFADVILLADFGHGLFEGSVLKKISELDGFIATNVQTNSGNFGFNPFTKHKHYNYISIDERECRLAMHDRITPTLDLTRKTVEEKIKKPVSITLGSEGSLFFDLQQNEHLCPAFFTEIVDTTGAGDAYFALTSLLVKLGLPGPIIPFLGNCFAGLQTRIIGNKTAVSKVDFVRTVKSLLT